MRYIILSLPILLGIFFVVDRVYLRTQTAVKDVKAASLAKESILDISLEEQEIVNQESIHSFTKDALSAIFNYAPGQAEQHINSEQIKSLFITDKFHNMFADQFINWSNIEFQINSISIKESFVKNTYLTQSPSLIGGRRIWQFDATLPVLDRAVGGTSLKELNVSVYLVYLGHQGGLGIYGISLR